MKLREYPDPAPWRTVRVIDVRDAPASRPLALGDALSPSRRLSMPHPCVADGRQYRGGGNMRRQGPGERVGKTPARFLLSRVPAQVGHRQCDVIRRKPGSGWGGTRGQPTLSAPSAAGVERRTGTSAWPATRRTLATTKIPRLWLPISRMVTS
jgi:hypothetical protein